MFSLAVALQRASSRSRRASELSSGLDAGHPPPLAIRITSPLGRTGTTGAIRIVAQVSAKKDVAIGAVRFYVDNTLVGEDPSGPPFAVEWTDENPFEAREITRRRRRFRRQRRARQHHAQAARDRRAHARSRASTSRPRCRTRRAASSRASTRRCSRSPKTTSPQTLDVVRAEQLPATYTLLIDSSQSMARRIDFVRDAATQLSSLPAREGPDPRRAVLPHAGRHHRARPTIGPRWPMRSRRSSPRAARPFSTRWRTPPGRSPSLEGRHAIILLTDGYDEHSTQAFDDALAAVQRTGAAVYVVGIGGVAGISLKGERFLQEAGQRHRRPRVLPDARDRAEAHPRAGGQRGDAALHPHLRAEEPEGGRHVAQDRRGGQRPHAARARQARVLRAEARRRCGRRSSSR